MTAPLLPTPPAGEPVDGRRARGDRTRATVVSEAVQLASVDGLEGLTIAHLADRLGVHKSSAHTAFGSKADLQVAVLRRTREILIEHVIAPSLTAPSGRPRLLAVGEAWFAYLAGGVFEGGCLLSSAAAELDGRPGPARDELVAVMTEWLDFLAGNVRAAIRCGDLRQRRRPRAGRLRAAGDRPDRELAPPAVRRRRGVPRRARGLERRARASRTAHLKLRGAAPAVRPAAAPPGGTAESPGVPLEETSTRRKKGVTRPRNRAPTADKFSGEALPRPQGAEEPDGTKYPPYEDRSSRHPGRARRARRGRHGVQPGRPEARPRARARRCGQAGGAEDHRGAPHRRRPDEVRPRTRVRHARREPRERPGEPQGRRRRDPGRRAEHAQVLTRAQGAADELREQRVRGPPGAGRHRGRMSPRHHRRRPAERDSGAPRPSPSPPRHAPTGVPLAAPHVAPHVVPAGAPSAARVAVPTGA